MKKDKLSAIIIFLVILFIVFVIGLFVGKHLSPLKSREGIIQGPSLNINSNPSSASLNTGNNRKVDKNTVLSTNNIKFAPISKLVSLKKKTVAKKIVEKPVVTPKIKVKTKIIYIKKPVYIYKYRYKYITKKPPVKQKKHTASTISKVYYTIQVAAVSKYEDAKKLAGKLNSMGLFAYIVPVSISKKTGKVVYQQIRVGKFSTNNGAEAVKNMISKKFNLKPYIVKINSKH